MKKLLNILILGMIILGACNKENLDIDKIQGTYRCEYFDFHKGSYESSVLKLSEDGTIGITSSAGLFYLDQYTYNSNMSQIHVHPYPVIDTARGYSDDQKWIVKKVKGKIILNIPSPNPNYTDLEYIKYE
jgi:hypothetical protein